MPYDSIMSWTWAGWEPLQFYRRLGGFHEAQEGNAEWADEWMRKLGSERTARALKDAGINWVTTHFYKGFGIEIEDEEMREAARLIENFHRHGVKVFTYIQYGTIMPETVKLEDPSSAEWYRRDWNSHHDGHPYEYGTQYWRAKPCANQPGFREYLLKCVEKAVEFGADGIWIDNLNSDGCHCPECQRKFNAWLAEKIADPWRELGVKDVSSLSIPRSERPRDPVFQEWIKFRCEEVRGSLEMICRHARKLKPDVVMAANIGIGNPQRHVLENANWISSLSPLDFTYAENHLFPAWEDEKISSQHFTMSLAEAAGIKVVPGAGLGKMSRRHPRPAVPDERQLRRCFAESAMFGGHAYGGPWGLRGENAGEDTIIVRDSSYRRIHRKLCEWYAANGRLFSGSADASAVGILYSFEALLGDEPDYAKSRNSMAQLLMQNQIPFRYVLSDRLDLLSGIRMLILPNVLPISDSQAARIGKFVKGGGRVLATGRSSLYDEKMRMRRNYALADVFGADFSNSFEDASHDSMIFNCKNGSVLIPGSWGLHMPDGSPACEIPSAKIAEIIREMLSDAGVPEVFSPMPHIQCSISKSKAGKFAVGLLNYSDTPVRGIRIFPPRGKGAWRPSKLLSPGKDTVRVKAEETAGGRLALQIPELDVEAFLV